MTTPVADAPPRESSDLADESLDKSNHRVREMFRQIAPRYDLMNHLLSLNIDKYWRWQTVRRLDLQPDLPVLDVCTGTGDLAFALSSKAGPAVRVLGSDFCRAMLEIAREKHDSDRAVQGRPTFFEADSQSLPFADDMFQCVTVAFGLRNVADTDRGLREMIRVCRPGGQVVVLEFSKPRVPILAQLYSMYFRWVLPKVGQWMARNDKSAYHYLPQSVGQFPSGQALADRMQRLGLVDVSHTPLTLGVATIYQGRVPSPELEVAR